MIVAFEFHDLRPSGEATHRPEQQLDDFGARRREPHGRVFHGDHVQGHFGNFELALELGCEHIPPFHVITHLAINEFGRVSEQVGPHALDVVDVLVAVDVPHACAPGVGEEQRHVGGFIDPDLARNTARDK